MDTNPPTPTTPAASTLPGHRVTAVMSLTVNGKEIKTIDVGIRSDDMPLNRMGYSAQWDAFKTMRDWIDTAERGSELRRQVNIAGDAPLVQVVGATCAITVNGRLVKGWGASMDSRFSSPANLAEDVCRGLHDEVVQWLDTKVAADQLEAASLPPLPDPAT